MLSLEDKKIVLKKYVMLKEAEHHFSELQYRYRRNAIYWIMGVFAGIGFLMSKEFGDEVFNHIVLISCVSIGGSVGIFLLWSLDMLLYHRLLDAVCIEEIEMEKNYDFLPKPLNKMFVLTKKQMPEKIQTTFYVGLILICLFVSMSSLFYYQLNFGYYYLIFFIPIKIFFVVLIIYYIYSSSKSISKNCEKLKSKSNS